MKTVLAFLIASPLTFSYFPEFQTIRIPAKACSQAASHTPSPHPPHISPSTPSHGPLNVPAHAAADAAQAVGHETPSHIPDFNTSVAAHTAGSISDDGARNAEKQFKDAGSTLKTTHLATQRSFVDYLDLPIEHPRLLSLMPSDEQSFKNVYARKQFTASNKRSLESFQADLAKLEPSQVKKTVTKADLENAIAASDARPVVIFGHSEDQGKVLVLPSGDKIAVSDVHAFCQVKGKACMVLTCDGDDFGINGSLVATHAIRMWGGATRSLASEAGNVRSIRDFREEMVKIRAALKAAELMTLSVPAVAAAGGGVYVVSSTGDRKPARKQT